MRAAVADAKSSCSKNEFYVVRKKKQTKEMKNMIHNRNTNVNKSKKVIFRDAEHNNNVFKSVRTTHLLEVRKFKLWKKIYNGVLTFFHATTIHGIVYLARRGLHIIERYGKTIESIDLPGEKRRKKIFFFCFECGYCFVWRTFFILFWMLFIKIKCKNWLK